MHGKSHSKYSLDSDNMQNGIVPAIKNVYPQQSYCLEVHFSNTVTL
jgi:hypothetical protein